MQASSPINHRDTDEIARAEAQVELHKAELARSLRVAGRSGARLALRLRAELKPAVLAAGAVAGIAVLTGVGVALLRRRQTRHHWLQPEQPSALAGLARGAGLWLARVAVRRLAKEVAHRLAAPAPSPSVAATPDQV